VARLLFRFSLERCSVLFELAMPRYARQTLTSRQPFDRVDRPVAALGAAAKCDAVRIGFLSRLADKSVSGRCV
jgi:hypothetical protein